MSSAWICPKCGHINSGRVSGMQFGGSFSSFVSDLTSVANACVQCGAQRQIDPVPQVNETRRADRSASAYKSPQPLTRRQRMVMLAMWLPILIIGIAALVYLLIVG